MNSKSDRDARRQPSVWGPDPGQQIPASADPLPSQNVPSPAATPAIEGRVAQLDSTRAEGGEASQCPTSELNAEQPRPQGGGASGGDPGSEAALPQPAASRGRGWEWDPAPHAAAVDSVGSTPTVIERRLPGSQAVDEESLRDSEFAWLTKLWLLATGRGVVAGLALMTGILGFYLVSRVIELYASIAALDAWAAWVAVVLLGLCVLAVLSGMAYFFFVYLRLRANRQIQLAELEQLDRRTERRGEQSLDEIRGYLESYPLGDSPETAKLFDADTRRRLEEARERLLNHWWDRLKSSPVDWVHRYVEGFQSILDEQAEQWVGQVARLVAFKTAISPHPLLDLTIVLFWSFRLLGDLCRIYQLRIGRLGTAALLVRIFFNAYVAARLDEWEEHVEDGLDQALENLPLPDLAQTLVGRIGAKSGTGLANYFLIRRLGKRAKQMLALVAAK